MISPAMPRTVLTLLALVAAWSTIRAQAPPRLTLVPGSTVKLEQLVGDHDKERRQATRSQTYSRFGVEGTDLGNSFEHDGRVYFLFGDTLGPLAGALDTIGVTDDTNPEDGVRMDFLTMDPPPGRRGGPGRRGRAQLPAGARQYLTINPPGIPMGPFEVPVAGLSLNRRMYVVVSTNHSGERGSTTDRSVLTRFTPPTSFQPLRTISQLPAGRFVKMSLHREPRAIPGLPAGGPFVLMWGSGVYRDSDAYLAIVPEAHFEDGQGTRYFAGLDASQTPKWSEREADAVPVVRNGTIGDLSVTWCPDPGLWLMTYDSRPPARRGVELSYAPTPWGPWSEPQLIFDPSRDPGAGRFIHASPNDGLSGPVIGRGTANPEAVRGGAYAPYVVERWTRRQGNDVSIYYVLSTWNPYVVVLMKSVLRIE
jgi:hypothetical protein